MPGGAHQAIQLTGQNLQNLQGLQVLPLSALQVSLNCISILWAFLLIYMLYHL